ncbi:MAG: hypothetical protein FJ291_20525 [Planctomycetes bacterium]|nr:hypothetical protein [Planctomycetota bacterium]
MGKARVKRRVKLPPVGVALPAGLAPHEARSGKLTIRVTPTERRKMQELADHFGTTVTNVLVHLVDEALAALKKGGK